MNQKDFNLIFIKAVSDSSTSLQDLLTQIKDGPKLSASSALKVYQEDYQARLTEALKNSYKALYSILGDEDFFNLSADYMALHPSVSPDLDDYGGELSAFLNHYPKLADYPFLSELAHFEWCWRHIFHQEEITGLSPHELMNTLNDRSKEVQLVTTAKLLEYQFDISGLFTLKDLDDSDSEQEQFDYLKKQNIVIYKKGLKVLTHVLSQNQMEIVKNFLSPSNMEKCFQNAPATITPEEIQALFQFLGSERLICLCAY